MSRIRRGWELTKKSWEVLGVRGEAEEGRGARAGNDLTKVAALLTD